MRKTNIFKVGGQVCGDSFLGRKLVLEKVGKLLLDQGGGKGLAIIGINRIGKSSLISQIVETEFAQRSDTVILRESLYSFKGANHFWHRVVVDLDSELMRLGIEDELLQKQIAKLLSMDITSEVWFSSYLQPGLLNAMARLKVLGFRVLLILEEFDSARELFKLEPGSLGLIRDMATETRFSNTVVTISRRKLFMIEQRTDPTSSTLEGAFDKFELTAFDESDLQAYWGALLADYDVFPDMDMKEKMTYLAGNHPYLLSLYANRMAGRSMDGEFVTARTLEEIHEQEYGTNIAPYYETLVERMKEDGYAEKLRGIIWGPAVGITQSDVDSLMAGGYLSEDQDGYYILSREFTEFFKQRTKNISLPLWDGIMAAELALREMVCKVYPRLNDFSYTAVSNDPYWTTKINQYYPEINLRPDEIMRNLRDAYEKYNHDATVGQVLALRYMINDLVKRQWPKFQRYFEGKLLREWEPQLNLLVRARNPMGHCHVEYLTESEVELLPIYSKQVADLNPNQ